MFTIADLPRIYMGTIIILPLGLIPKINTLTAFCAKWDIFCRLFLQIDTGVTNEVNSAIICHSTQRAARLFIAGMCPIGKMLSWHAKTGAGWWRRTRLLTQQDSPCCLLYTLEAQNTYQKSLEGVPQCT
ncbi:hypothetical protein V1264_010264 [Littorina saxatilis]|uniref:Uncharacterized protein n=1 Tax=Littorina saxatilis TaxID=31220 RepID=A0AAN9AP10_9CAEN